MWCCGAKNESAANKLKRRETRREETRRDERREKAGEDEGRRRSPRRRHRLPFFTMVRIPVLVPNGFVWIWFTSLIFSSSSLLNGWMFDGRCCSSHRVEMIVFVNQNSRLDCWPQWRWFKFETGSSVCCTTSWCSWSSPMSSSGWLCWTTDTKAPTLCLEALTSRWTSFH